MAQVAELGQLDLNSIIRGVQGTLSSGYDVTKNPLAAIVNKVTVFSNYSPETSYTGAQLEQRFKEKKPSKLMTALKPSVIIDTKFGAFEFAPYGRGDPSIWKARVAQIGLFAASGLILYGVGMFVWGRSVGRKGG
jgi:hypothetical protein